MEKLKNLLSPAHKTDEETMYAGGDNSGKVAGEGSHFGDAKSESHPAGASEGVAITGGSSDVKSDAASTTALKEGVSGPYSEDTTGTSSAAVRAAQLATGTANTSSQRDASSGLPIYDEMTGHPGHSKTASPYSSHDVDPRVDGSQSHSTRNTAIGGGLASAAAATAYEVDKSNRGPEHESVATAPSGITSTTQPSTTDPIAESSNIGTAVTTGADSTYSSTTPSVPKPETSAAAHTSSIETTPSGATTSSALPVVTGKTANEPEHHFAGDAALGAGAGAAGLAAYETSKHHEPSTHDNTTTTTTNTTGSGSSGPLGSLRDLINQKTGAGGAATADTGASSVPSSSANESSSTGTTGLPLGTIRPLVDEKTSTNTTTHPSATQLDGTSDPIASSTSGTTTKPLSDTTTGTGAITGDTSKHTSSDHHYARDIGVGTAAGAGLAGTYDYLRKDKDTPSATNITGSGTSHPASTAGPSHVSSGAESSGPTATSSTTVPSHISSGVESYGPAATASTTRPSHVSSAAESSGPTATASTTQPSNFQSTAPIQPVANEENKDKEHHYGRDAAIGAGAAGVGAAAYEHHQREEDEKAAEKARKEAEKQHEKEVKQHEKEVKAAQKEHEKEVKAAEKQHQKEIKEHEKEVKAAEKQHEKEVKAAEKQHEKEVKEAEKQHQKEIKAHEEELAAAREAERHKHEKEAAFAGVAGAGAAGLAVHEHDKKNELGGASSSTTTSGQPRSAVAAEDPTQRDRVASIADTRAEGRLHSTDAGVAGAAGLGAAGLAAHEHGKQAEDPTIRERLGSLAAERGEGKIQPSSDIPPTTTSGSGITAYEHEHERGSDAEPKQRKGSILDIFKRHKNDDDSHDTHKHEKEAAAGAGVVGAGALGAHEYEKHHESSAGASTIDPARSNPATDFPQSVSEQKVYRDSLGRLKSDPTEKSVEPTAPTAGVIRNDLGQLEPADTTGTSTATGNTDHSHRGLEAAAVGAGVGAVGAHEHNKHHDTTAATTTDSQAHPAHDHPAAEPRLGEATSTSHHHHHHHHHNKEAAAAGAAGGLGAAAVAKEEHDNAATGTAGDLGDSRGWVNEGYVHHKTPADIEAEKRNDIPVIGLVHREGRFHGKEGGAPGAVGVPPSERDAAYIESQKHLPTLHGNSGAHGEEKQKERSGVEGAFNSYDGSGRNKLHKDPPAGHPAALAAAGAGTGAGIGDGTSASGESGLLHGHHAETLKDTPDTNVENPKHDPAGMGYDGKTHLNLG